MPTKIDQIMFQPAKSECSAQLAIRCSSASFHQIARYFTEATILYFSPFRPSFPSTSVIMYSTLLYASFLLVCTAMAG